MLRRGSCPPFETEILIGDNNTVPVLIGATLYERNPFTWTCFVLDLTERREREAQQIFIMRELNHRTKNSAHRDPLDRRADRPHGRGMG